MKLKIGDRVLIDFYASRFHKWTGTVIEIHDDKEFDLNSTVVVHFDKHFEEPNRSYTLYKYKVVKLLSKKDLVDKKIKQLEDKFKNRKNEKVVDVKKIFDLDIDWDSPIETIESNREASLEEVFQEMEEMFEEEEIILRNRL